MNSLAKTSAEQRRGFSLSDLGSIPVVLAGLVAITAFAIFYQQRWGTITDTSWLITVCERVLAGDRLYVDLFETNPPFSVWLYMPPVALAGVLGIEPEILVHAWTYLAALAGLGFAGFIVRRAGFPEGPALFRLAPVFYALLVFMPGNAFSQREHIAMALFLPLLALTAWRAKGDALVHPSLGISMLTGLCGSMLVLVKPYYALMVLAPALLVVARRRSLRPLFAPEYWTIGVACVAYLALVVVFDSEFITNVYPMVAGTYVQVRFLPTVLERYALPYAAVMALVWFLSRRRGEQELATVAILASAAGIVCLVYQCKGFPYHAYPAFLCAVVALLCLLARPKGEGAGRMSLRAVLVPVVAAAVVLYAFTPFRFGTRPDAALVEAVRSATERPTVVQIGTDLAIGHPFSRAVGGRWVSAYSSDWLGSSALMLSEGGGPEAARHRAMADDYVATKRAELERQRPDIILTQNNDILWQKIMAARDGLAPFLENYRLLAEGRTRRVLIRKDYSLPAATAGDRPTQ